LTIVLDIEADGLTGTRADVLSRQLAADIRALRSLDVSRATEPPPDGSKSTGHEIATLVVTGVFSAATVRALRDVIVAYIDRTKVRGVKVRVGKAEVTLTGASASDLAEIIEQLPGLVDDDGPVGKDGKEK
jgi:hypothetical protein